MALCKLERRNYGRKWPVSIKYQNLHSFKEGLILLCQSILEKRRITLLHGSTHFTILLSAVLQCQIFLRYSRYLCYASNNISRKYLKVNFRLVYIDCRTCRRNNCKENFFLQIITCFKFITIFLLISPISQSTSWKCGKFQVIRLFLCGIITKTNYFSGVFLNLC